MAPPKSPTITPDDELVLATWDGPFDAQCDDGSTLVPGDEYEITAAQARGAHWLVDGEPFERDVDPLAREVLEVEPLVEGAGDVVDVVDPNAVAGDPKSGDEEAAL